jgi:hypothetical protein
MFCSGTNSAINCIHCLAIYLSLLWPWNSLCFPQWYIYDPASDMAPSIVIVTPFAVGMVPFAGAPFRERPWLLYVCRLNLASSMNTQFLQKSKQGIAFHSSIFSFRRTTTWSEFLVVVNFSSFFSVTFHFCTKCLCNAEIDIVSPGNALQRWCLISENTAAGCSSTYSTRNLECSSVNLPIHPAVGLLHLTGKRFSSSSLYFLT